MTENAKPEESAGAETGEAAAAGATTSEGEHLSAGQLYPILYVLKGRPPPSEGEGAYPELASLVKTLPDRFLELPPKEEQLTRKQVERAVDHIRDCRPCNVMVFEDGPASKPPKTKEEIAKEESVAEKRRREKVKQFWVFGGFGSAGIISSQVVAYIWQNKDVEGVAGDVDILETNQQLDRKIDPLLFLFVILVLIGSVGVAYAYTLARELGWIEFTAWKRAVPVIGAAWAERDLKRKAEIEAEEEAASRPKKWQRPR